MKKYKVLALNEDAVRAMEDSGNDDIMIITEPDLREAFDSPAFTGVPTSPTAAPGTNTTQIATTGFVQEAISNKVELIGGKIPEGVLPSYVDDVIDGYYYESAFYTDSNHEYEIVPEEGKIYVDISSNKTYRWSGSIYVQVGGGEIPVPVDPATATAPDEGKPADAYKTKLALEADATLTEAADAWVFANGLLEAARANMPEVPAPNKLVIAEVDGLPFLSLQTVGAPYSRGGEFANCSISSDGLSALMLDGITWALEVVQEGGTVATRSSATGYQLGDQSDKPLAKDADLHAHVGSTNNPHGVTGQQVGVLDSNGKVDANLVVESSITDGAVSTAKIADGAVTAAKIDQTVLGGLATSTALAAAFTAKSYAIGDLATYNGLLYRCKAAYTATAQSTKPDADTTHWEEEKVSELFLPLTGGTITGDLTVAYSSNGLKVQDSYGNYLQFEHLTVAGDYWYITYNVNGVGGGSLRLPYANIIPVSESVIAQEFHEYSTYAVGDVVIHAGDRWRCTTAVTTAGAWSYANWTRETVEDALDGKVDKSGDTMTGALTVPTLTVGARASGSSVGVKSVSEGHDNTASGECSHADGQNSTASEYCSHAEGYGSTASGYVSHAEGQSAIASGYTSHAEGYGSTASGSTSHAEGSGTASGDHSHAEGSSTASGDSSHAEGGSNTASGNHSHAEGAYTTASGATSHAEGSYTNAQNASEHAQGQFNASHKVANSSFGNTGNTLSSVGFGTALYNRKNAVETMQDGKTFIYGLGGYDGTNPTGSGVKDLASAIAQKANANHTHSNIVAGDTTVSAVNGGTATISKTSIGNAKVTFPEGFSVTVRDKTYTAPSGGETIEFIGPYQIEVMPGFPLSLWIPSSYADDPQSFSPYENGGQWYMEGSTTLPNYLGFYLISEGSVYLVSNFNSLNPTLTLDTGSDHSGQYAVGGPATITRESIGVKTIATIDQLNHLTSADGTVTVTAQNDGTVTIEKPGAEIDMDDPLSSLIDYLDMPAGSTFDEVRQALGLSVNATLQDAANAVPSSINLVVATTEDVSAVQAQVTSLAGQIRYSLADATPTVSGNAASVTVEDRAITSFTLESGVTSLAITPPAAVSGKARDFFCRVTVSGSSGPGTVTLGTGQTIDIGSSELTGMTTGINVLMFTEIASGHWMVSRKSAS